MPLTNAGFGAVVAVGGLVLLLTLNLWLAVAATFAAALLALWVRR